MNIFIHADFIKRLWQNRSYFNKFMALHTELTEFGSDFNMITTLRKMLGNQNQNQIDLIHISTSVTPEPVCI
jgi:hypothetical protein